jgi:hypothetical protein
VGGSDEDRVDISRKLRWIEAQGIAVTGTGSRPVSAIASR